MCPYCAQTNTRKDEYGYCIKYGCQNTMKEHKRSLEIAKFNRFPVISTVEIVKTTKVYNYGKLVDTIVTHSY